MLASSNSAGWIVGAVIVSIIVEGLILLGIFRKAGAPIWGAFVPIVNFYFLLKIVGRPGWWLILYFIPCVNLIIYLIVAYDLSKSFGHGFPFFLGLVFLSVFFLLWLSYSGDRYVGPAGGDYGAISKPNPPPIPSAE